MSATMANRVGRTVSAVVALAAVVGVSGCGVQFARLGPSSTAAAPVGPSGAGLSQLPVLPEDTAAPYRRADWGDWIYDPQSKCNTRELVLRRDGAGVSVDGQCRSTCPEAAAPCWTSSYDGAAVRAASQLEIDHVVALAEASRSGAAAWPPQRRAAFYNDLDNLVAVSSRSNESKSDRDPGSWRPTDQKSWCRLASTVVLVKTRYGLSVDASERDGLAAMLATCPPAAQPPPPPAAGG